MADDFLFFIFHDERISISINALIQ